MAFIYKITNKLNGKFYIGFTSKDIKFRWKLHVRDSNNDSGHYIHRAIRKYGSKSFTIEVIEENEDVEYTKTILEPKYIKQFNTLKPNGYNLTTGGEGNAGYKATTSTCLLNSKLGKERWSNLEYKKSQSKKFREGHNTLEGKINDKKAATNRWKNNEYRDKVITRFKEAHADPEYRKRMSAVKKEVCKNPDFIEKQRKNSCKSLYEVTFPDGTTKVVKSVKQFSKENDLTFSAMYRIVSGLYKQHKGFTVKKINKGESIYEQ